jgi:hypothetical protein
MIVVGIQPKRGRRIHARAVSGLLGIKKIDSGGASARSKKSAHADSPGRRVPPIVRLCWRRDLRPQAPFVGYCDRIITSLRFRSPENAASCGKSASLLVFPGSAHWGAIGDGLREAAVLLGFIGLD